MFYLRHIYLILHLFPPQSHSTILDKERKTEVKIPSLRSTCKKCWWVVSRSGEGESAIREKKNLHTEIQPKGKLIIEGQGNCCFW